MRLANISKTKKIALYVYVLYVCIVVSFLFAEYERHYNQAFVATLILCVVIPMTLYGLYYLYNESRLKKKEETNTQAEEDHSQKTSCIGIANSWPLMDFAKGKRMQVGSFIHKETKETFHACIFTDLETQEVTYVAFSSLLGELTPAEIAERKYDLLVSKLDSGHYTLHSNGMNNFPIVEL